LNTSTLASNVGSCRRLGGTSRGLPRQSNWRRATALGSRHSTALFNACVANLTWSTDKSGSDPDGGPTIPLGGAVTVLKASISFPPCRRPSMTICSCGLGVSSPWQCRQAHRGAIQFARAMKPVENSA